MLESRDIVILLELAASENSREELEEWRQAMGLEAEDIAESLNRAADGGLYNPAFERVSRRPLRNFIVHGIPHVYPTSPGERTRGVPTAHSHPVFHDEIVAGTSYVWPMVEGEAVGLSIDPIDPLVVRSALRNPAFHTLAAIVDAFRVGRARDRQAAGRHLRGVLAA